MLANRRERETIATQEEVLLVIRQMEASRPMDLFRKLNKAENGAGAVLRVLHRAGEPVTAGAISQAMGVSTARVAVLLKKLEGRGLIRRAPGAKDARKTMVRLTGAGDEKVAHMYSDYCAEIARLIDCVGMDRLGEFAAIAGEINAVMVGPSNDAVE